MSAYIDAHAHLPPADDGEGRLVGVMDQLGIERTIIVAGGTVPPRELARRLAEGGEHDTPIDNARVLARARTTRQRLLPFFFANPMREPTEYREVGRDFFGLKFAPGVHGVVYADERLRRYVAVAAELGHSVYAHCLDRDGLRVKDYVALAADFPGVTFMLGHAGIGPIDFDAVERLKDAPNVLFETSGGFSAICGEAVRQLTAARVVFGSEFPLQHPKLELEKIRLLGLDAEAEALILGGNARRLLRAAGADFVAPRAPRRTVAANGAARGAPSGAAGEPHA
jgi:predicted TIM-barrel fold metal-dependent hydrolase